MAKLTIVGKKATITNGKVEDTDVKAPFKVYVNYTIDLEECPANQIAKFLFGTSAKVSLQNNHLRPMGKATLEAWQDSGETKHFTWKDCLGKGKQPRVMSPDEAKQVWITYLNTLSPEQRAKEIKGLK